jgi:hypothetical protein
VLKSGALSIAAPKATRASEEPGWSRKEYGDFGGCGASIPAKGSEESEA